MLPCDSEMLEAIIKYLKSHDYNPESYLPTPLPHSKLELLLKDEDSKWISKMTPPQKLAQMLELAIHIQLIPLVDLCAAVAAASIRGRQTFIPEITLKDIERTLAPENSEAVAMLEEDLETKYYKSLN